MHPQKHKKTIGLTLGDPLGIGAEIALKAVPKFRDRARFRVFGEASMLQGLLPEERVAVEVGRGKEGYTPLSAGKAAVAFLDAALSAYESSSIDALVTAPISKTHVKQAGFSFPGHTEYLAHRFGVKKFAMMMAGPKLKVALVTIHEPLARVPGLLETEKIVETVELVFGVLQTRFGIRQPRVAVCGLNPHAGEGGLLGREELDVIAPAIDEACRRGFDCQGPRVPDAVFHEAYAGLWDAVICMYHDQGLIPFKMVHFEEGVNVTLGLPLLRTSPDHGTAFDIAGKGVASSRSMEAAIRTALEMMGTHA